jgi:hypothetical protein
MARRQANLLLLASLATTWGCSGGSGSSPSGSPDSGGKVLVPVIDGDFWQIAGEPDLGSLTTPTQQPVDFAVWPAPDGTWQLWSCIRGTNIGGNSRLFYRWEGSAITAPTWTPKGIAMEADPSYGETPGGLQAPYVFEEAGLYHMVYGDWEHIAHQTSADGKTFTRVLHDGMSGMFSEGPGDGTRDPMVLKIADTYYAYYTANPGGLGADYVRTSNDLATWSASTKIASGGEAGTGGSSAECPFVVYRQDQQAYYLFRTQHYGTGAETRVYRSTDPTSFGIDDDSHLVARLPVAAPEIVVANGQYYIAALLPSLQGIHVAKLVWQ